MQDWDVGVVIHGNRMEKVFGIGEVNKNIGAVFENNADVCRNNADVFKNKGVVSKVFAYSISFRYLMRLGSSSPRRWALFTS